MNSFYFLIPISDPFIKVVLCCKKKGKSLFSSLNCSSAIQMLFFAATLVNLRLKGQHVVPQMYCLLSDSHTTNITASSHLQEINPLCSCFPGICTCWCLLGTSAITVQSVIKLNHCWIRTKICYHVLTVNQIVILVKFLPECRPIINLFNSFVMFMFEKAGVMQLT